MLQNLYRLMRDRRSAAKLSWPVASTSCASIAAANDPKAAAPAFVGSLHWRPCKVLITSV